jgi:hypothetical protein
VDYSQGYYHGRPEPVGSALACAEAEVEAGASRGLPDRRAA